MATEVLGDLLPQLLRAVVRPVMADLHRNVLERVASLKLGPCTCPPGKARCPVPKGDKAKQPRCGPCTAFLEIVCELHSEFKKNNHDRVLATITGNKSSNRSLWQDPVRGPFEMAKLFMANQGNSGLAKRDYDECDLQGLATLMRNCVAFNDRFAEAKREVGLGEIIKMRNAKVGHAAGVSMTVSELLEVLRTVESFLQAPGFTNAGGVDLAASLKAIVGQRIAFAGHAGHGVPTMIADAVVCVSSALPLPKVCVVRSHRRAPSPRQRLNLN